MLAFVATGSYYTRSDERSAFPLFSFFFSFFFLLGEEKRKGKEAVLFFLGGCLSLNIAAPFLLYTGLLLNNAYSTYVYAHM